MDLPSLRSALTTEEAAIINEVWDYFVANKSWMPARLLHQNHGGKRALLEILKPIGGSVIYQYEDAQNLFYRLTFLGILLTKHAGDFELLLGRFLRYTADKYLREPKRTHISNIDLKTDKVFSESEMGVLGILLAEAPIMRGGHRSGQEWNLEIPRDIEDLPADALPYVHSHALGDYDPNQPVELEERTRYWQTRRLSHIGLSTPEQPLLPHEVPAYVDPARIAALEALHPARFDLTRLIEMCKELNSAFASGSYLAVAMLTRAVIDHVPPIFGASTFSDIPATYKGVRSFKESMAHLGSSCRKIADAHLHVQVRSKDVLPTRTQVNFSNDLDVLLAEVVRILSEP